MLDEIIQYKCGYHPAETDEYGNEVQPTVNEDNYLQMVSEINLHVSSEVPEEDRLSFEQLSPIAQDVMREWESMIEQKTGGGQSIHSEQEEV